MIIHLFLRTLTCDTSNQINDSPSNISSDDIVWMKYIVSTYFAQSCSLNSDDIAWIEYIVTVSKYYLTQSCSLGSDDTARIEYIVSKYYLTQSCSLGSDDIAWMKYIVSKYFTQLHDSKKQTAKFVQKNNIKHAQLMVHMKYYTLLYKPCNTNTT